MVFQCFYYPTLNNEGKVVKCSEDLIEFSFGDEVPTKTLYYNYGENFAIFENSRFFVVENSILKEEIDSSNLKFPLKIVFNQGTQLTIFSRNDLSSIRLLLSGENEQEKELGELFFLSRVLNRQIKSIQYNIMEDLTNCSRDFQYINNELSEATKELLEKLKIVEGKFYNLTLNNPDIKDSYLTYMNFNNQEDMLKLSIYKYFKRDTEEYKNYYVKTLVWNNKPIYPKFKLDTLINSFNYRESYQNS